MKYLLTILAIIILATGCRQVQAEPEPKVITKIVTEIEYVEVEVGNTEKINALEEDISRYSKLIGSLNTLLGNVYYGYAENENYILDGFTAFSMEYNGRYYLITAGHAVENNNIIFTDFKFKANYSDSWIYPRLLTYKNLYTHNEDYAIFYSEDIDSGLAVNSTNVNNKYVLGANKLNTIRRAGMSKVIQGESGSPVINLDGEVIEILTGGTTDIDVVLRAIDNLE